MNYGLNIAAFITLLFCVSCAADPVDIREAGALDDLKEQFNEYRKAQIRAADTPGMPQDTRIRLKFQEELWSFGEQHSVSSYELRALMGEWAIDRELWGKGGVGTLGHPLYVVLEGERNIVLLGDGREWKGRSSGEAEIVLVTKDRDVVDDSSFDYNDGVIIFFRPDEVRFIDFSTNTGGRYTRRREASDVK